MPVITAHASHIAGQPVSIVCSKHMPTDDYGLVYWNSDGTPQPVIYLRYSMCTALKHADQGADVSSDTALAMLAVTHEAEHIALASKNEALVEKTAIQNRWQMIRLFKLPAWISRFLMGAMLNEHADLPAAYHPNTVVAS